MIKTGLNLKKILIFVLAFVVIVVSVIPFIDNSKTTGKVQLVVDLHGYTPSTSRIATAEDPDVFNSTYYIAQAFMEENPDVEIVWARTKPVGGLEAEVSQWFTTQIAGGTVPAIAFSWGTRYQERDWYLPLDEYLDDEWTYDDEYETWRDVFRDYLWKDESVINARGEVVSIPVTLYPGSATGYYYNKTAFEKSGITSAPLTWKQFIDTADTLTENGYIGVAPWSYFDTKTTFDAWVWGSVVSPSFGGYVKNLYGTDYNGDGVVSVAESARAALNGYFQTSEHEYAKDAYRVMKDYYTNTLENGWGSIEYYGYWLLGDVGMREEGIWAIPYEDSTPKDFDYGVFVAPYVSNDSYSYLPEIEYSNGPYEPSPDLCLNIMKAAVEGKPEVLDAAVRFLKFLTKPDNVSMICIENAGVLGAVKGTGHSKIIDDFIRRKFPVSTNASWPAGFTDENKSKLNLYFEQWTNNEITDEQFFAYADELTISGAKDFIKKMNLDTQDWGVEV